MTGKLTPADVALLARLSGLRVPAGDLEGLAGALEQHLAFVEPLLAADLDDTDPALTHDPRWHD
jgi:hypothetical protein